MTSDETLRFPLGRFARQDSYTAAERAAHIERLATQPTRLTAAVSGFVDRDWESPYRPGGWTVRQLVHHIADSHAHAYLRVKFGLTEDEPTIKPYDQDSWVTLADSRLSPLVSLTLLDAIHTRLIAVLRSMTPEQFARTINHPENGIMTLDHVAAMYAWHGDHHVRQIENYRAAHQLRT
jgi:hypothetical protein